jgi:hypothetical protein
LFWVRAKPHTKGRGKGKKSYMMAVRQAATTHVCLPIIEKDIEVEINYSTLAEEGVRADIDNRVSPTHTLRQALPSAKLSRTTGLMREG